MRLNLNRWKTALAAATLLLGQAGAAAATLPDPHAKLVEQIAGEDMAERTFQSQLDGAFRAALSSDADVQDIEAACPGFIDGMTAANRPILWQAHVEDYQWYREKLDTLFRDKLTEQDAASLGNFFASDLGQKFLAAIIAEQRYDNTIAEAMSSEDGQASVESMLKDHRASSVNTLMALEPIDRKAIGNIFTTEQWAIRFGQLQPDIIALMNEMAERDFTAEQDAAMDVAIDSFIEKHLGDCEGF